MRPPAGIFTHVTVGGHHTCGLTTDGQILCWGWNGNGKTDVLAFWTGWSGQLNL